MNRLFMRCALVFGVVVFSAPYFAAPSWAAPVSQSFTLRPGWNAVFLQVEPGLPEPTPELVFAGVPGLLSVWAWNRRTSPVQFIDDPDEMTPASPYMLSWFPGQPMISNLHAIHGERAYLIHRDGAAGDYTWVVNGEPTLPSIDWVPDSFNLVGFHAATSPAPDMETFFSASAALAGQEIYRLNSALGAWEKVANPLFTPVNRGEAFWVFCRGGARFAGPLSVQFDQGAGLIFGSELTEGRLTLRNASATQAAVTAAISAPEPQLHYWFTDVPAGVTEWRDMAAQPPAPYAVPAGGASELRLGVLRAGIPEGAERLANLRITGDGMEILVPVSVTGIGYEGLWVGDAVIRKVSQPRVGDTPVPTGAELSFRLIVHNGEGGQARLLREVVQLWQESTATYVLVANPARLGEFTPGALRDGQPVGRRISSAGFGFAGGIPMAGSFELGQILTATVRVLEDDATNPFRHLYHPDHGLASQSYRIERTVELEFTGEDTDGKPIGGASVLGWGSSEVGGVYREAISLRSGDSRDVTDYTVHIEGTFLLRKASDIRQLVL